MAVDELERLLFFRQGGRVKRFHVENTIVPNSNAQHCHGVAMLLIQFFPYLATDKAIIRCLSHDLAEHTVGDMPAPVKWKLPEVYEKLRSVEQEELNKRGVFPEISTSQAEAIQLCDYFEAMLYCYDEIEMGNRYMMGAFWNLHNRILGHSAVTVDIQAILRVYAKKVSDWTNGQSRR